MSLAKGRSSVQCGPLEPHTKSSIFTTAKLTGATFSCYKNTNGHLKAHDLLENGFGIEEKGSKFLIVCDGIAKKSLKKIGEKKKKHEKGFYSGRP